MSTLMKRHLDTMDLLQPNCPLQDKPKHKTTISTLKKLGLDMMSVDEYDLHLNSDHEDEPQNPSSVPLEHLTSILVEILAYEVVIFGPNFATVLTIHNVDHEKVEVNVPSQQSLTNLKMKNPTIDPIVFTRRVTKVNEGLVFKMLPLRKQNQRAAKSYQLVKKFKSF
jgi:hypothetical protein